MYRLTLATVVLGLVAVAGCKHHKCGHHRDACCEPRPFLPSGPRNPVLLPPTNVPTTPVPPPGATIVPPVGPSGYPPPIDLKPAPEVLLPDPVPGAGSSRSSVLGAPAQPTTEPPVASKGSASPSGLAGTVRVKEGVASGHKPSLDGFDSLKQAGFRTALYLHAAGADVASAKEVATQRGLTLVALETTPEKLAEVVEQFNAVLADRGRHPIYVFDDDGVRAGAVWYLHFRTAEAMNDDAARVRARPLGLTDSGDEAKAFALATQRYLESR